MFAAPTHSLGSHVLIKTSSSPWGLIPTGYELCGGVVHFHLPLSYCDFVSVHLKLLSNPAQETPEVLLRPDGLRRA